jgi:hypothetical protein
MTNQFLTRYSLSLTARAAALALALVPVAASAGLTLDGLADEPAWQNATAVEALKITQPDTGAAPEFVTHVRYLALPEGIAFHFDCPQNAAVFPKRAARQPRDNAGGTDRVNVMLDFDGTGEAGYNFTLTRSDSIEDATISNENLFNADWDGLWYHAVAEKPDAKGWSAEFLIPWSSALMRRAESPTRSIGLYVDRVIGATETRAASPAIVFFKQKFLSLFSKQTVNAYSQGLLRVLPYATVLNDFVTDRLETRVGADVFWKPSSSFQLTATLNPDFGQVEADDLVVNFDAVESFFSDKRPFFTENQSAFVRQSPENEQLIYTRRIGGARDDGAGASDIDAAVKVSGSASGLDLGLFAVRERDPDLFGRQVLALRVKKPGDSFDIGYLGSYVERPFLARTALVHAIDTEFSHGFWRWGSTLLASQTRVNLDPITGQGAAARQRETGFGGFSSLSYKPSNTFDARASLTRYGNTLNYNDVGFQRRSNVSLLKLRPAWQKNDYGANDWLRSRTIGLEAILAEDSAGTNLYELYQLDAQLGFRDGANAYMEAAYSPSGLDDLVSRGNGSLRQRADGGIFANYDAVRRGNWRGYIDIGLDRYALNGRHIFISTGTRYWFNDDLNTRVALDYERFNERTLWQNGTLFARYRHSDSLAPNAQLEWFQGSRHELRAKAQWLAIRGKSGRASRLQSDGRLRDEPQTAIDDFAFANFGVQLRYRYKLNQDSDVFVVYSRGGSSEAARPQDRLTRLLGDSLELRDADQFLVKLRYGF